MGNNEKEFENFVASIKFNDAPDPNHRDKLEHDLLSALAKQRPRQTNIWRTIMKTKMSKMAAVAVIALIVLGGLSFWPTGPDGEWWPVTSAVAQEIIASLEKVEALVYRQQVLRVREFGSPEMCTGWERRYNAEDRYRRDRYDDGKNIANIQWVIPDGNAVLMVEVSLEYKCYFERKNERHGFVPNPVEELGWHVRLLDRADRILGTREFDGRECIGFEINARKYGNNSADRFDRIWFDIETKLPARIEKHGLPSSFHTGETFTIIHDQFEYYREVPLELFEPQIPEGFVNAHPDDIRAAEKGEMTFADVPAGLRDEIVAALKNTETVVYRQGDRTVYLSPNAWRYDYYSDDRLRKTQWYVFKEVDTQQTGFEIEDKDLQLVRTTVDFDNQTYQVSGYPNNRHPMHKILFLAGFVDRADRMLENQIIDEIECFGFEISAKKYGDNPDSMIHRLWFDVDSKLLVRMEFEWDTDKPSKQQLKQQFERDQFQWDPELPADTFTPEIPEGFELANSNGR